MLWNSQKTINLMKKERHIESFIMEAKSTRPRQLFQSLTAPGMR